ncbi:MAG: DNA mismatch repair endonuclease MutL [Aeromonas sp.]
MAIQVLSPILANQIAAGEVVERPSSVVKELVENSLDAGASKIDIDIEQGGAKLIRIRDNGCGVAKGELTLALARHATSKLASLDDLEAIMSLGFRGEALASISSVARLTFTSRTATQSEAWQAMAQGREMGVTLTPAAHPVGSTVAVADLFFNTPARRKFMRSDKTEFAHIDELVRRIALSRFEVAFTLRHNGKVMRQYRAIAAGAANHASEQARRLGAICGAGFMQYALAIESSHSDVRLWGWLATADGARAQSDLQYTYVNGRMMRDKLINHAIRQAYADRLPSDRFAAYVLYIELDARQVDVNVHPAKHEVRFHQARLVHDFIYQALAQALHQASAGASDALPVALAEGAPAYAATPLAGTPHSPARPAARCALGGRASHGYQAHAPLAADKPDGVGHRADASHSAPRPSYAAGGQGHRVAPTLPSPPAPAAIAGMQALLTAAPVSAVAEANAPASCDANATRLLTLLDTRHALLERAGTLHACALDRAERYCLRQALLAQWTQGFTAQPLLLPVALKLAKPLLACAEREGALLTRLGVKIKRAAGAVILTHVPALLRHTDLATQLPALLLLLEGLPPQEDAQIAAVVQWLAARGVAADKSYDAATASRLVTQLCALPALDWQAERLLCPLDLSAYLEEFARD